MHREAEVVVRIAVGAVVKDVDAFDDTPGRRI
jgi:hypothetical protein